MILNAADFAGLTEHF